KTCVRKFALCGKDTVKDALRNDLWLTSLPHLTFTTLYLKWYKIGDNGTQHLTEALRHNTALTTLDLGSNRQGADDALPRNYIHTMLNLDRDEIRVADAQHFGDVLRHNTTLTTLNLRCNSIRIDGARHLAAALRHNTTLTTLNLQCNEIRAAGAQYFADTLRKNTVNLILFSSLSYSSSLYI
ncbi:unnamed protein product, partial [Rotaria magnacalcarata]